MLKSEYYQPETKTALLVGIIEDEFVVLYSMPSEISVNDLLLRLSGGMRGIMRQG